jgi:gliding motility-associated-like protein
MQILRVFIKNKQSKMKKIIVQAFAVFIVSMSTLYAQVPDTWKVNPSDYNNSMVITAVLNMESLESRNPGDVVAAFIGNEVRGVASPVTYLQSKDRYVASVIVYSNDQSGLITFKLYDKTKNTVSNSVTLPVTFIADGKVGTFDNPLVIKDNTIPTELTLSNSSVNENKPVSILIGTLSVTDGDQTDTHTLAFLDGTGFEDNAFFEIKNDALYTKSIFDFETKSTYTIRIQAEDNKKGKVVKTFQIGVVYDSLSALSYNNLVTPNGDGHNDVLVIDNLDLYKEYNVSIYNVRGQLVYSAAKYQNDWRGEGLPDGEYYLYFESKSQDDKEFVYKEVLRLVHNN